MPSSAKQNSKKHDPTQHGPAQLLTKLTCEGPYASEEAHRQSLVLCSMARGPHDRIFAHWLCSLL
jgi:hypothetical protein